LKPITPDAPRPAHIAKPSASRPQAGPSRTAAASKPVKKPLGRTAEQSDADDHDAKKLKVARARKAQEEIVEVDEPEDKAGNTGDRDDEIVEMDVPPQKPQATSKKPSSRSNVTGTTTKPDSKTNGITTNAAAKGKAKAKPKPIAKPPSRAEEDVMEVDDVEEDVIEDADEELAPVARPAAKARTAGPGAGKIPHRQRRNESQEVARLNEQLSQVRNFGIIRGAGANNTTKGQRIH
jgi:hypothetical protein